MSRVSANAGFGLDAQTRRRALVEALVWRGAAANLNAMADKVRTLEGGRPVRSSYRGWGGRSRRVFGSSWSWQPLAVLVVACGGATDELTHQHFGELDGRNTFADDSDRPQDDSMEDMSAALCGEPILAEAFVLDNSTPMTEVFVDATSTAAPEGTFEAPFLRISDALLQVEPPARIYVAISEYAETFSVPPGVQLFGGYEPGSWEPRLAGKSLLRTEGLGFSGFTSDPTESAELSALVNFEVHGSVDIAEGARVILQGNILTPTFIPAPDLTEDTHRSTGVSATGAVLRAQYNTLYVPSPEPNRVVSRGFIVRGGCARLLDNQLADMRIPFAINDTDDVVISYNLVTDGKNGINLGSSDATVVGNELWLTSLGRGCLYGVYLEGDSRPRVRGNDFHLESTSNVWFDESSLDADPVELVGNTVYAKQPSLLYIDELNRTDWSSSRLHRIEQVNALSDIETVGDNRLVIEP